MAFWNKLPNSCLQLAAKFLKGRAQRQELRASRASILLLPLVVASWHRVSAGLRGRS